MHCVPECIPSGGRAEMNIEKILLKTRKWPGSFQEL